MSVIRELTTAVKEVAILFEIRSQEKKSQRTTMRFETIIINTYIKPRQTSNTLSLRIKSVKPVTIVRMPRLNEPVTAALLIGIVSVDNQGLSFGIWGCRGFKL